ncbi:MAG: hypothetical protein DI563_17340, partial [Variovorax paradoxus]
LAAALFPRQWLLLFGNDPAMLEAGTQYLRAVGPLYGFFGLGLVLYFASQGAGRLMWPVFGTLIRLAVAGIGGWLALRWGGQLVHGRLWALHRVGDLGRRLVRAARLAADHGCAAASAGLSLPPASFPFFSSPPSIRSMS